MFDLFMARSLASLCICMSPIHLYGKIVQNFKRPLLWSCWARFICFMTNDHSIWLPWQNLKVGNLWHTIRERRPCESPTGKENTVKHKHEKKSCLFLALRGHFVQKTSPLKLLSQIYMFYDQWRLPLANILFSQAEPFNHGSKFLH